ncbi:MAG: DNA polymerase Y family protein [Pseudomonadota bacterium]
MSASRTASIAPVPRRLACVVVPALPLQILLRDHPDWSDLPCATVDQEQPQGRLVAINRRAREAGVLVGQRFAHALGICPGLRAGAVPSVQVQAAMQRLGELLRGFSPGVEPSAELPGVLWLDAGGLGQLYPSLTEWAGDIGSALTQAGWVARVAVGFSRFASFALASVGAAAAVPDSVQAERRAVHKIPLARLELAPRDRDALARLGVHSVGELLALPAGGLRGRFGAELHRLHHEAAGDPGKPLAPLPPEQPLRQELWLDEAEDDRHRLLFYLKRLLHPLLDAAAARGLAVTELRLRLKLERTDSPLRESLRPAQPTLDSTILSDLLRLWLERVALPCPVCELALRLEGVLADVKQLALFEHRPQRDLEAGERALARLRAELGEFAVVWAELREAHLPEAQVQWQPLTRLLPAQPDPHQPTQLVRALYDRPLALPPRLRLSPDGWLLRGVAEGAVQRMVGPYLTTGGWWVREVVRAYHFAEMHRGQVLWLYEDRVRKRWFVHGELR